MMTEPQPKCGLEPEAWPRAEIYEKEAEWNCCEASDAAVRVWRTDTSPIPYQTKRALDWVHSFSVIRLETTR